ncbi:MAG: alanine racemase [Desulfitobacterium sp.]|nr:alanine racemase [Desulfitobacterium sp.]
MSDAWIDIDLDAIIHNYEEITAHLQSGSKVMAVVKADAYGLGAVEVARTLSQRGCEAFAVTTVEEGLILRHHGIKEMILVMGPVSLGNMEEAILEDLHLSISDFSMLKNCETVASRLGKKALIHLKLETGMGRTGFLEKEWEELATTLARGEYLEPVGVFTHLARAAQRDSSYTQKQYEKFQEGIEILREGGIHNLMQHICNSAAFLDYPQWHHDFVRIGTLLIGHFPSPAFKGKLNLKDPWTAKARILHVRQVPKGAYVGYQSIYRTKKDTSLAVIPVGYADGFGVQPHLVPQGLWDFIKIVIKNFLALCGIYLGQESVSIKGHKVKVAGKIGMQITVLDLGDLSVEPGEEVIIPLRRTQANPRILRRYWLNKRLIGNRIIKEGISQPDPEYV